VRVSTAFKRLLDLPAVNVTEVKIETTSVLVTVRLRQRCLSCPACTFTTRSRYDARPVASRWRHLDLGRRRLEVVCHLRRLVCPTHGVRTEAVPFARAGSRFTRDFEDLVGWLATSMDKTATCRLMRIDWDSVGRIIERVMATELDKDRLDRLFVAGVDEVSWRRNHAYLSLVSNHETGRFVWGKQGKEAATLDAFFDELGEERAQAITALSMDMGPAFEKSARAEGHATKAIICYDPFHVVQLVTTALETVRRGVWQDLRKLPEKDAARRFKGARWALLKNPGDLTEDQAATLRKLKRRGGDLWRAYMLKEALRAVFAGDLAEDEVSELLDRFCSRASRSGLKAFVTVAQTIRKRKDGILAAVRLGINNARHEGLNRRVRLIVNRAYGFHSANAALGLIMLSLGPITHVLPHERAAPRIARARPSPTEPCKRRERARES
jgi:transposase